MTLQPTGALLGKSSSFSRASASANTEMLSTAFHYGCKCTRNREGALSSKLSGRKTSSNRHCGGLCCTTQEAGLTTLPLSDPRMGLRSVCDATVYRVKAIDEGDVTELVSTNEEGGKGSAL